MCVCGGGLNLEGAHIPAGETEDEQINTVSHMVIKQRGQESWGGIVWFAI